MRVNETERAVAWAGSENTDFSDDARARPLTSEPDIWAELLDEGSAELEPQGLFDSPAKSNGSSEAEAAEVASSDVQVSSQTVTDLCAILAGILDREHVAPDSDYFDDLGADSLLLAQFCARARSRDDLPAPSIRDVYRNRSIADLVDHLSTDAAPATPELAIDRRASSHASAEPATRFMYVLVGTLQAISLLALATATGFAVAAGFSWMAAANGAIDTYQRSVVFGAVFLIGWAFVPIVAKWLLIGRWKPERFPLWSIRHFRFWLVTTLVKFNPMAVFAGSPIFLLWLRALGAKIGRGVVYLSRQVPVCSDQLTIGDGAIVRADAIIKCYRASDGHIEIGPVTLGRESVVGIGSILDIDSSLGDRSQLGHSSTVISAQHVPDDVRVVGTPARQFTEVDYANVEPMERSATNRVVYSILQLALVFAVSLPFSTLVPLVLFRLPISPVSSASTQTLVEFSALVYFGGIALALVVAVITPRVVDRVFEPGVAYPLYGARYAVHRFASRVTNVPFFTKLLGDSSYILHYLYMLGYGVKLTDQTGSNFGTSVKHDSPLFLTLGGGTMVADGIVFANSEFSGTSFRLGRVTLAENSYFGNSLVYPPQGKTSKNCLVGTKSMIPLDGPQRENVGILGNPSFEIPRIVDRDLEFDDHRRGERLKGQLVLKNSHNRHSIAIFVVIRFIAMISSVGFITLGIRLFNDFGILASALMLPAVVAVAWAYNILVERAIGWIQPLRPTICSMYEIESWRVERFWKLAWNPVALNGTAMKGMAWKLLGVDIGRQVFDDGLAITERALASIGEYSTLNSGTVLQCHSQEDAAFKSDRVRIGSHCTLGTGSFVHYGTRIGDGATLETNAFIMKGSNVPSGTSWGENPARDVTSEIAIPTVQADQQVKEGEPKVTTTTHSIPDLESWRHTVDRAGLTPLPCLASKLSEGSGHVAEVLDATLARSISATASLLGVSEQAVFLAAHAKVVAVLTGEEELTLGYAPTPTTALPIVVDFSDPTWRSLVEQTDEQSVTLDARHGEARVALDAADFSLSLFETVFHRAQSGATFDVTDEAKLLVSFADVEGQFSLAIEHRLDTIDTAAAERILGYHLCALGHLVADVDAGHRLETLLSDAEVEYQLEGLAGPSRHLPNLRFHQLFEQRAADEPDKIAASYQHVELTYGELNARANQLARELLARGAKPEAVIGVVTERNLDWMTAVIAIFKIGGAYLPIEPHFPADRIASMLSRSDCRLVISEEGSTETLYEAMRHLPRVSGFFAATALNGWRSDHNLDIAVHADQLAYIYFTSGSTGQPKGAMCEHLGMLNHLYAKIDDFAIVEGDVVAQIAPQCFDISLWQLVSALLVGGRTVLIDQETLLDPERLIKEVVRQEIGVLQVVPSYLEVLLSHLEATPTSLGSLHCVSVTGEALSIELAKRWFDSQPKIKLANAYGLTETSDDTNHEVMEAAPTNGRVPLGRAVNNVSVRVVDPLLSLVPLGAPGEIVFSGMCVGRGYINDPERTAAAFVEDPSNSAERLYRSGDFGRWDADGKLEFLGRRDAQVKIRGFRIEIGDIENALLRVEGIRQGAVVITSRGDGVKQLVAFYSGERFQPSEVLDELRASLPEYMVPTAVHFEDDLPLSDNGKVDRKALRAMATEREVIDLDFAPPQTPTESRLAEIWAELLNIPVDEIGRLDNFFDRGANSLSAVELVTRLDRVVSVGDVTKTPVLARLAELIDAASDSETAERDPGRRELLHPLTENGDPHHRPLICFPYAGGNAINYQAMASALKSSEFSVYAVDLPGHDLGSTSESFESLDFVVEHVVDEIKAMNLSDVVLWGHSSGAAFALDTADRLTAEGVTVERVFIAAQVVGSVESREMHAASLVGQDDVDIARQLAEVGGYSELSQLSTDQAGLVGAAYRHDVNEAHQWFIDRLGPNPHAKLHTPVVAVLADDDTSLSSSESAPEDWSLLVDDVDVVHLDHGGHYFLRTQPAEAAEAVLAYSTETSIL